MATPLKERICTALQIAGGSMTYYSLMVQCFPFDEYPKAWRYQSNGGPPGCAMAFGKALREMGCTTSGRLSGRVVSLPYNAEVSGLSTRPPG